MPKSYLYTETAFHHEGNADFLKGLVEASPGAGAKGVKFQVLTNVDDFVSSRHKAYQALAGYCLDEKQWADVFSYTSSLGLDIIMMPLNLDSLKLTEKFRIKYLDIHSVSFNDLDLLEGIRRTKIDVILGVGGRTLEEIHGLKDFFKAQLKVLMVGFQSFPSKLEEVKINKIAIYKRMFPDLLIGYADHSAFNHEHAITSNEYARLLGATLFEKHITTVEGIERVDYSAAVSPDKIKAIIEKLTFIDDFILTDEKETLNMNDAEMVYRNRQLRCVASQDISAGSVLAKQHVFLKLVDNQENTFSVPAEIMGKKLSRAVLKDESITKDSIA